MTVHSNGMEKPPESTSIYRLLQNQAEMRPDACAILAPGRPPLSYRGLLRQADATVKALRQFGVKRNDRVAIVLPNGPEMATAFAGTASAATCAPLNPSYRAEEFDFYLKDLNARVLIVAAGSSSPAIEIARKNNVAVVELVQAAEAEAGVFELRGAEPASVDEIDVAQQDDIGLVLHTSGTTSRAKIVPLTHLNLCTSGRNVASTLALTDRDRCLNVMPLFHIHGLIGALMSSLTAGGSVVCTPGFQLQNFFGWIDTFAPTWYSAVPTIHQAVLTGAPENREIIARRPLRFIRSSSAALPPAVMQNLETVFQTQVIEAYGMTEAAHQMASNPLAPRPRKAGSVGLAAGPKIAVMDEGGKLLPNGEVGEIVIAGPNVTQGYENNPTANQSAFCSGWFRTGDQGRFDSDGYLFLTGRLKEMINRGGEKIAPREIDDVLTQHPAVAQAIAFALPHPTLGEEVAAVVVLRKDARATEQELRDFAAAQLADFKVPKQVLILDEIPKGPTGKPQRIGLAAKLADKLAAKQQDNFVAGQTSTEKRLIDIWKDVLKVDRIGVCDEFYALGGDSLTATLMLAQVKNRFQKEIPIDRFLRTPRIDALAQILDKQSAPEPASSAAGQNGKARPIRDSVLGGLKNRVLQYLALYAPGYKTTRVWLHRMRGVSIGDNVSIGLSSLIETAYPRLVSIGDNVSIGMRTIIIGHLRDSTSAARDNHRQTVRIENDAYIGPGVIILPNVTIGRGAVVSAGSIVSRSVPPHTLVSGNPARPVAHCGVSLGGGVSYEQFLQHLKPIQ